MSDREAQSLGRILALVLRHAPEKFGVDMDINGWVNTRELSDSISNQRRHYHWLRGWHFEAIANSDEKGRYQVEGEMIRATYGHSIELELDLPTDDIPEEQSVPKFQSLTILPNEDVNTSTSLTCIATASDDDGDILKIWISTR